MPLSRNKLATSKNAAHYSQRLKLSKYTLIWSISIDMVYYEIPSRIPQPTSVLHQILLACCPRHITQSLNWQKFLYGQQSQAQITRAENTWQNIQFGHIKHRIWRKLQISSRIPQPHFFAKSYLLGVHVNLQRFVTWRNFYIASRVKLRSHELKTLDWKSSLVI